MTAAEYEKLSGSHLDLNENEVAAFATHNSLGESFTLLGQGYHIRKWLETFPLAGEYSAYLTDTYCFIVADDGVLDAIYEGQRDAYGENASRIDYTLAFDLNGSDEGIIACYQGIMEAVKVTEVDEPGDAGSSYTTHYLLQGECRQSAMADFYAIYGGFLFLGIFLGLLFLMATVLIIYYKQVSEGYEDKERFAIMQQVGMSESEVRATIRSQILVVFFLPLAAAVVHLAAAFKMITKLLAVLNLTDISLFVLCTVATILVFALIYALVYALTARVYYRIVR